MESLQRYRAPDLLCAQAVFHPAHNWKWVGQPARWEYLAKAEVFLRFKARTADHLVHAIKARATPNVKGSRWKTIATA
jgi:hypothetical protein